MRVADQKHPFTVSERVSPHVMAEPLHAAQRGRWLGYLRSRARRALWALAVLGGAALVEWAAISVLSSPS